ncbi:amino acid ABC transporter ATP-binding/permease protein [Streptococcus catagoni]|uniref:amino acid ABC transporter ATP-binding/permease protein n=1 Tax=Streptococcus catagoni TaxID=2654874 RepID=UPI00140E46FE|nr:ABC transporter ATP-binding protein [Streptococcus catagoni]
MVKKGQKDLHVVRRLLQLMKNLLPFIALAVLFAVLGFVLTVLIPVLLVYLALNGLTGQVFPTYFWFLFIGLALLRGACRYGEHYFGHYVAFHTLAKLRGLVFRKLRLLTPAALDQTDSGHLLKMIGEDIEALEIFFAHTIAPICTGILSALLIILTFGYFSFPLALIALLIYLLLALVIPLYFAKDLEALIAKQTGERKAYASAFIESLRAMKDLLQFQVVQNHFDQLNESSRKVNKSERRIAQKQFMQLTMTFFIVGLGLLLFGLQDFYQIQLQTLSFSQGLLLLIAFSSSFAPFLELGRLPLGFKRAIYAAKHLFALLDQKEALVKGGAEIESVDQIAIEDLNFSYSPVSHPLYKDLSAIFSQNGIIAIQGESGSGKSTLMKLIMRWYPWQDGKIYLHGRDSLELDPLALQKKIAYLPQHPQLFQQSIRDNLTLGRPAISDAAIWELAQRCGMKERLLACDQGLDTLVSDPNMFSAGERQRLELMRALLKKVDCYIFDEPSSHLDSLNEALLISIIKKECHGLVFLISHRLSTLACADRIFRLDQGQLKEIYRNEEFET